MLSSDAYPSIFASKDQPGFAIQYHRRALVDTPRAPVTPDLQHPSLEDE